MGIFDMKKISPGPKSKKKITPVKKKYYPGSKLKNIILNC